MINASSNGGGPPEKLSRPQGAAGKVHMEWNFEERFFDYFYDFDPVETSLWSPALMNIVDSSVTISTVEEFSIFRKSLLNHVGNANKYDMHVLSQLIRMTLVFLTSPLSDTEMEQLRLIKISKKTKAQLIFHASNLELIEFNKKIVPILTTAPSDIPSMDNSDMPLMGVNVIEYTLICLKCCIWYTKAPLLMNAANSIFVAAPKFIFAEYKCDIYGFFAFMGPMCQHFDSQYVRLFYESLDSRFSHEMMKDWLDILLETKDFGDEFYRLFSMICAIMINKESKGLINPCGKMLSAMLYNIIDGGRDEVLWFLRTLDLKRLLYRMKYVHTEFCRPKVDGSDSDGEEEGKKILSEAMSTVLMEHLNAISSMKGPKKRLICMLIEYITAWTDSANLMINLALRWVTTTDDHRTAIAVIDMLVLLISKKMDFLMQQPAIDPSKNSFLAQTCNGVIFPDNKYLFVDVALNTKKEYVAIFGQDFHSIPDGFDISEVVKDSSSLSAFLSGLYFHTSSSALTGVKVPLGYSFHNLSVDDLIDLDYPKNGPEVIKIQSTVFMIVNEQYTSQTKVVMSQSKFFGIKKGKPVVKARTTLRRGKKKKTEANELFKSILKLSTR